jgi:D-lactate dehydrogenase (cytochrome)
VRSRYDLTQLYMGSEGTLGVIVSLVVRVRPIPRVRSGALLRFNSVRDGAAAVIAIVASNLKSLARCELLNADGIAATNRVYDVTLPQVPTLILEFQASVTDRNAKRAPYTHSLHSLYRPPP